MKSLFVILVASSVWGTLLTPTTAFARGEEAATFPEVVVALDRDRIVATAEKARHLAPLTITAYPAQQSKGERNDFFSMADYFWPDPATPTGLPYVNRDGQSYPGVFSAHRMVMRNLRDAVAALAAAYLITRDEGDADQAARLLRGFFVEPATRMNPHLNYAQAVLGRSEGRSYGIIDTLHLVEIPLAVAALRGSKSLTPELEGDLKRWFADLSEWMLTSTNGIVESKARNNHSVAFWLQIAAFAQLTGNAAQLAECRRQFKEVFLPNQMAADGSFPLELARSKPYAYSIFQLDNLAVLCRLASTPADDLWTFTLPDGRGMRRAVAYLYPFLADKSKWPLRPDVQAWADWPVRQSCLLFAGLAFQEHSYLTLWRRLPADSANLEVRRNVAITQPLLWVQSLRFAKRSGN